MVRRRDCERGGGYVCPGVGAFDGATEVLRYGATEVPFEAPTPRRHTSPRAGACSERRPQPAQSAGAEARETMANVVATRFSQTTIDALDAIARERRRTRAEIVREAVDVYLTRWADYGMVRDRLADLSDEIVDAATFWSEVEAGGD